MDSLFGPEALKTVAGLVGVEIKENDEKEITEDDIENKKDNNEDLKDHSQTSYNIRKGREDDVFVDNTKVNNACEKPSDRVSEYSYEDFEQEFLHEKTSEELYEDDIRAVAEYSMQDGGTYEAGRVLDKEYLVVGYINIENLFVIYRKVFIDYKTKENDLGTRLY